MKCWLYLVGPQDPVCGHLLNTCLLQTNKCILTYRSMIFSIYLLHQHFTQAVRLEHAHKVPGPSKGCLNCPSRAFPESYAGQNRPLRNQFRHENAEILFAYGKEVFDCIEQYSSCLAVSTYQWFYQEMVYCLLIGLTTHTSYTPDPEILPSPTRFATLKLLRNKLLKKKVQTLINYGLWTFWSR